MVENKTKVTAVTPRDFVGAVAPAGRRADGLVLLEMFSRITGFEPRMWGQSIIGYGRYYYTYDSGHSGSYLATGFSPRKAKPVVYIMPGYQGYPEIMARLGKHRLGKSCLYINKLADIDLSVLEELVHAGLADLDKLWKVHPV
ncbi:DUF1801 domain-containing protein [Lentibacter algarum]|uniref:DUF1801 domain-containing protein n=1 Tax=Lentibacter algarum TaxID=576131 RepID=UPI001C0695CC|nr:DUF1801 domain-containing protein [Lentibacter algarum]MBU2980891.1 DUF1801 domain-containing protein [Lentibacter algarum]